jgi:hypothetical protein
MRNTSVPLLALSLLLAFGPAPAASGATPTGAAGVTVYALTTSDRLVTFAAGTPNTLLSSVNITGLLPGEALLGIDFRPLTEELYLLGSFRLYRLNTMTGVATAVGPVFTTFPNGSAFGVDFNPTVDRLRVVSDNRENLRLHPDTGAVLFVDGLLHYADGDPNFGVNPVAVGAAYTNSFPGATSTTLYDIDSNLDVLVIQNPPNDGTLVTVGPLGVDTTDLVGFDIQAGTGIAYASLTSPGAIFSTFYTINLSTGETTAIGNIAGTSQIRDIAIPIGIRQGADTVGVYSTAGSWFLRNSNSPGPADTTFNYGPGGTAVPVRGDYDGDSTDTAGVYIPATATFFLKNSNASGAADIVFTFGAANVGFVPLVGDWNGDGVDTIGVYSPATGTFFLRNENSPGPANLTFSFGAGNAGLKPIAGDWNGDGVDTVGVYSPTTGAFFLRNQNSAGPADAVFTYGPGGSVIPVPGDYDNSGTDTVGVYDPGSGAFFLRNANSAGPADIVVVFGTPGLTPLVGDWDGL